MKTQQDKFDDLMARFEPHAPEWWREALPAWVATFLDGCERAVAARARFAEIVATGDLDAIWLGTVEFIKICDDIQALLEPARNLDALYVESAREWLQMVESADRTKVNLSPDS